MDVPGIGGGRFKPYIKAIVEAERAPIKQMELRKSKENDRLKLFQEFLGKVRKMGDAIREVDGFKKFRELKADFGKNEDLIGVEVDKDIAETGSYQLEVVQLAGRHSMISNGFDNPDAEVGVGFFSYSLPNGATRSVYLNSESNTLSSLVKAINSEKDLGLQANLVNDGTDSDSPWRIIVAGKETGMKKDLIYPEFYFVDGDIQFSVDDERNAKSAIVKLNGFEILSEKNKISDLIPGVNLDLKQAKEGYEFEITIKEDVAKIAGKMKSLVDGVNAVLEFINKQNQLDERSDTTRTLGGDGMLRSVESQLRQLMVTPIQIDPEDEEITMRISDLGIQFERNGLLNFNADKFQKKLSDNFNQIANFFNGEDSFVGKMRAITNGLVGPAGGILIDRERGFRDRTKKIDEEIARKEDVISKKEENLKRQFGTLEASISQMQGQQQYLASALGGGSVGGIPVG